MKHDRIGIAAVLMTSIIALSAFGGGASLLVSDSAGVGEPMTASETYVFDTESLLDIDFGSILVTDPEPIVLSVGTRFVMNPYFGDLPVPSESGYVRFAGAVSPATEGYGLTSSSAPEVPDLYEGVIRYDGSYHPEDFYFIDGVLTKPGTIEIEIVATSAYIWLEPPNGPSEPSGFLNPITLTIIVEGSELQPLSITSQPPTDPIVERVDMEYVVSSDVPGATVYASCPDGGVEVDGNTINCWFQSPGEYEITVTVSKTGYVTATQTFTVEVVKLLEFELPHFYNTSTLC